MANTFAFLLHFPAATILATLAVPITSYSIFFMDLAGLHCWMATLGAAQHLLALHATTTAMLVSSTGNVAALLTPVAATGGSFTVMDTQSRITRFLCWGLAWRVLPSWQSVLFTSKLLRSSMSTLYIVSSQIFFKVSVVVCCHVIPALSNSTSSIRLSIFVNSTDTSIELNMIGGRFPKFLVIKHGISSTSGSSLFSLLTISSRFCAFFFGPFLLSTLVSIGQTSYNFLGNLNFFTSVVFATQLSNCL